MDKKDRLKKFIRDRDENRDWINYISRDGVSLIRQRIIEECGFSRSSLYQNETVKSQLSCLEIELQRRGILKAERNSNGFQPENEVGVDEKIHELNSRVAAILLKIEALSSSINDARAAGLRSSEI